MSKVYLIPDRKDIERSLELAEEYDCAFEYNDFFVPEVLDNPKKQEEIIAFYGRYRRDFSEDTMHGAFLDITIHSSDRLIRDASVLRIHQSMEIAKSMGLKGVVFHTGKLAGFNVASYINLWHEKNLKFFMELAEEYPRQQIYMENMFDEAPEVIAGLAKAMKGVPNFGICLDYAHAAVTNYPLSGWVKTLAPYIRHMHINDNDLKDDLHQPVGEGKIDWQTYSLLMREHQIEATTLIEVKGYENQKKSLEFMKEHHMYPFI